MEKCISSHPSSLCVFYFFGKEQFVNPYHDYFDDHVSRNGEQDAQQTEEIAAYKDEGNRGQRVNIKLFPVDDRCQNIILDLLCDDNNDNGPYRNGRRFDKSDNDGRNGRQRAPIYGMKFKKRK